jgi:hypothetical protein
MHHLHKIATLDQLLNLLLRHPKHVACCLFELLFLIRVDVRPLALCEAVSANRALTALEEDDGPVATRLALPWPCDPLLDETATEIRIHLTFFSAHYGFHERGIADFFLSSKPREPIWS